MKIAVIGAGFGGMAAAYDLRRQGHDVTVLESADYVGGLASGFKEPHWAWSVEKFYHHWFQSDRWMLGLIRELGWQDKVIFPRPYTVLLHNGRWYPFDSIAKALLFPGLGFGLDKIRFGFVGLFLRLTNGWKSLERHTADAWMTRWAGRRVYEKMWKPLLIGKFGPYYRDVNMAWMWARLKARSTRLGTFEGGFQNFADLFAARLREMGVDLRLGARQEAQWLRPGIWLGPSLLCGVLALELAYFFMHDGDQALSSAPIPPKQVGIALFGPYALGVELASMLLLAGLVGAYHLGRRSDR